MKRYNSVGWQGVMTAILITLGVLLSPAFSQLPGVTLLLQQSPAQGGTVIPAPGVYDFALGAEVTLTAVPKAGYHFVCWLGDVSDPTSSTTTACLNKPKIIIAVFQQTDYDVLLVGGGMSGSRRGVSGAIASPSFSSYTPSDNDDNPTPPEPPDKEDDPEPPPPPPPPPPVPEPATMMLLGLGGLALLRGRRA